MAEWKGGGGAETFSISPPGPSPTPLIFIKSQSSFIVNYVIDYVNDIKYWLP